jgi:hypothetical protein
VQEIQTQRKPKVSPNIHRKEVQQETGGDEMDDSGSSLHYKRKKRNGRKIENNILLWKKNFSENLALILCLAEKSQLGLTVKKS